ncbi:MAG: hypothetical protein ACLQED_11175 [Desulfobaccales bacterium]
MVNEDNVLFILIEYLFWKEWKILAYKSPGGHGGMIINVKGQPKMIPDMIAYKEPFLLCVEAKPNYSFKDKNKLDLLFSNNLLFSCLKNKCNMELVKQRIKVPQYICYIKTLAYAKGTEVPGDFIVFKISKSEDVLVYIGNKLDIDINDI